MRPRRTAPPWRERLLLFLHRRLFSTFSGILAGNWYRLLEENDFAVDVPNWPRAALMTLGSLANSDMSNVEEAKFGKDVAAVEVPPPLFVLGHWRNGTTHLHNLLALDPQFAYPNNFQVVYPHTFLSTEEKYAPWIGRFLPERRPQDNVKIEMGMPQEEEFGLCVATLCSPYLGWMFPRREEYYQRYLTFHGVSAAEIAHWKAGFLWFLKKLTWKLRRPLLLKSPPHTARVKLLLEMFPDSRFVHIHRNPYRILQSTRKLWQTVVVANHLHRPPRRDLNEGIIRRFQLTYDAFFEERKLIPAGRYCEVAFEELEKNPVSLVRDIYEKLELPGFDFFEPALRRYVDSLADYRKNEYQPMNPTLGRRIAQAWRRSFEEWGYPI